MAIFSWQKESKFLFSQVRLPPDESSVAPIFSEGMEVEVYSRSNDREACGWWCADIKVCFLLPNAIDGDGGCPIMMMIIMPQIITMRL